MVRDEIRGAFRQTNLPNESSDELNSAWQKSSRCASFQYVSGYRVSSLFAVPAGIDAASETLDHQVGPSQTHRLAGIFRAGGLVERSLHFRSGRFGPLAKLFLKNLVCLQTELGDRKRIRREGFPLRSEEPRGMALKSS